MAIAFTNYAIDEELSVELDLFLNEIEYEIEFETHEYLRQISN